jgi:phosphoribosylformylglycinamidine cyclo-ligase
VFKVIQRLGNVSIEEMRRVFNLGIGMVIIASQKNASTIVEKLQAKNIQAVYIGSIIKGK